MAVGGQSTTMGLTLDAQSARDKRQSTSAVSSGSRRRLPVRCWESAVCISQGQATRDVHSQQRQAVVGSQRLAASGWYEIRASTRGIAPFGSAPSASLSSPTTGNMSTEFPKACKAPCATSPTVGDRCRPNLHVSLS